MVIWFNICLPTWVYHGAMVFTICFGSWGLTSFTAEDSLCTAHLGIRGLSGSLDFLNLVQQNLIVWYCFHVFFAKSSAWWYESVRNLRIAQESQEQNQRTTMCRCIDALLLSPRLDQALLLLCSFLARSMIKAECEKKGMRMSDTVIKRFKT